MRILIEQGRVICPKNQIDKITNLAIDNGKILTVDKSTNDFKADKIIDAKGKWVLPGLVDIHSRPQMQHPEGKTILHETRSSLMRGMTTLCLPPESTIGFDNQDYVQAIEMGQLSRLYPIAPMTEALAGVDLSDMANFKEAGYIAVSQGQAAIANMRLIKQCYDYAATFDLPVVIQAQDPHLSQNGVMHQGIVSTRLGFQGIPETAETTAVAQHLLLIEQCGIRAHFSCLSSQRALELIKQAKDKGLPVTCDVAITHLLLTEYDLLEFDPNCHVYPPLRSLADQEGLIEGVKNGTIDAICSNHQPVDLMAKLAPIGETLPGMSTLDVFLSLALHLAQQDKIPLPTMLSTMTHQSAACFSLPGGTLTPGALADVIVVDPHHYWVPTNENLLSKGKNCFFKGWELPGKVCFSIVNGIIAYADN